MTYCSRCNRSFRCRSDYDQHVRDSSYHWKCWQCHDDADFESLRALKEHYVQSPRHSYCQYCDLHLDSPSKLQDHYEVDHPYCSSCNKVFKNDLGLHEHNRQKPEHADLYCVACRKLFRAPHSLRSHYLNSRVHRRT
ncbi:hypothetical protein P692DRAFT_20365645 [Suillus brevipes Sb2]|nr:hypothetical protein P692DRAFT_20365645 [Suillus brevipes Sb2]